MNASQAETAVTGSALVVGGIYIYRRLSEGDAVVTPSKGLRLRQAIGAGPPLPTGTFVVAWGFTFLVIALMAQASPKLGGWFAMLVGAGAVLGNGLDITKDVNTQLQLDSAPGATAGTVRPGAGSPPKLRPVPGHMYPSLQGGVAQQGSVQPLGKGYE